jgi:hypothetical protein
MLDAFCRRAGGQATIDKMAVLQQRPNPLQLPAAEYLRNDNEHLGSRAE